MTAMRKIIHIDMDAFYASVEQRDNPKLRNLPIAVGGDKARGVISAASYEARKYGVRSAMASVTAKKRCPQLIFVPPNMNKYSEVSKQIRKIFLDYTELVEPLSLDEAFLDVTTTKRGAPSATLIANEIRKRIFDETGLTASAGISYCKFLAKIASDVNKPNGFFCITPNDAQAFLKKLKIKDFFGVGAKTAERFHKLGIRNGNDLLSLSRAELISKFGKSGSYYYNIVRGIDNRPVMASRARKSLATEHTFETDIKELSALSEKLHLTACELYRRIEKHKLKGRTITLKIKFEDFTQITRSHTKINFYSTLSEIEEHALALLKNEIPFDKSVRLMGISLSNFAEKDKNQTVQLTLNF